MMALHVRNTSILIDFSYLVLLNILHLFNIEFCKYFIIVNISLELVHNFGRSFKASHIIKPYFGTIKAMRFNRMQRYR